MWCARRDRTTGICGRVTLPSRKRQAKEAILKIIPSLTGSQRSVSRSGLAFANKNLEGGGEEEEKWKNFGEGRQNEKWMEENFKKKDGDERSKRE